MASRLLLPLLAAAAADEKPALVDFIGFPDHTPSVFNEIDADGDGDLSTTEIERFVVDKFGSDGGPARAPQIVDSDFDGKFTYIEFVFCEINIFTALDENGDAKLSLDELTAFPSFFKIHAESLVQDFDADRDGFLHWSEMHKLFPTFLEIDANSDAKLSKKELEMYLAVRPRLTNQQRAHMVAGMLDKKDQDKDGFVSWPEFKPVIDIQGGDGGSAKEEVVITEEDIGDDEF